MFRNIVYSPYDKAITLFTWDSEGNRIEQHETYKPYLYIEDDSSNDAVSIFNTRLKKIEFDESFKRRKFSDVNSRTFYNLQPEQQYLIEKFSGLNKDESFKQFPLKVYSLDIETDSRNGFPDPKLANDPISLISVHNSLDDTIYTFGLQKDYYVREDEKVKYRCYATEKEMMASFLRWWRKDFPDVVTGWYSDGFDLPYICNRINKLYDDDKACNKLSPVERTYKRDNVERRLQSYEQVWTICGVTHIDYQYIYKMLTRQKHESYSLDYICEAELGVGKLAFNAVSLTQLADTDWSKFVRYNIQDVLLLVRLEEKLKYLETCKEMMYASLSPMINTLGTSVIVTGVAAQKALELNKIIPTFTNHSFVDYAGGFVKEPQKGLKKSLLYFDANSLYPNTIITLNSSPETKFGKILKRDENDVEIITTKGQKYSLTKENFETFIKNEKISISKSNILFTQKVIGIFPSIVTEYYQERVQIKSELKKYKKMLETVTADDKRAEIKLKIERFDSRQSFIKVFINSVYGYFGEPHSPMYDVDIASSITLTGQNCIKQAAEVCDKFIKDKYNLDYDSIIMSDTDSFRFDTMLRTDIGALTVSALYDELARNNNILQSNNGHEIITLKKDIKILSFDEKSKKTIFKRIKRVFRHKVSKRKYLLKVNGKEIYLTEDHTCVVYRNNTLINIKPYEILKTDKIVTV